MTDQKLIRMIDDNGLNLNGDIECFAPLVAAIRAREEAKPWVKTYSGGTPHYTTPEEKHTIKTKGKNNA